MSIARSLVALLAVGALTAAETPAAPPIPYPLTTCVVTGEPLGSMGAAVAFVREGRELKVCCKGCIRGFDEDPARYLKRLDEAAAAKPAAVPKPAAAPASAAP